jgi:predicted transcriptional regulator
VRPVEGELATGPPLAYSFGRVATMTNPKKLKRRVGLQRRVDRGTRSSAPRLRAVTWAREVGSCSPRVRDMADPARSAKDAVVAIVSGMPEDSTYDEILEEPVFNRMVERGLADADAGRVISDEEMKRTIDSWRG